MFEGFPATCRDYGVRADIRALLTLQKAVDKDLVHTLGDIYTLLKAVVVKDPKFTGPFTQAFYDYFVGVDIQKGEKLSDALLRSETFEKWREMFLERDDRRREMSIDDQINQFLDEVHLTSYDIKNIISGEEILADDDPDMKDEGDGDEDEDGERPPIDTAADYRNIDLEELRKRMEQVAKQQKSKHRGGDHWIGTGGRSPYGHGGAAFGGIRVGGSGGGKMARQVIEDHNFYPVDVNASLSDNNIDAALASLKGIREESAIMYLDIPQTIRTGLKRGGLFLPIEKEKIEDKLQVLLLIDNGGYSMDSFIRPVTSLFKKMKTRFAHDLEVRYFHNTIGGVVYKDERRRQAESLDRILSMDPNYRVFVVGDAAMAPYELNDRSVHAWMELKKKFKKMVWINPTRKSYWEGTYTVVALMSLFPMFPMTPKGIEESVLHMNRLSRETKSNA